MFLISFLRTIKFSFQDIARNIWLSVATVTILVLALFSVNMLFTVDAISKATISSIKEKVDVNLYLNTDAADDQILSLKTRVANMANVKEVRYISKAQALESFKIKHQGDPEILEALRELGKNPLTPSLVIKPADIEQYDSLITNLNKINDDIIESRNFDDHKIVLSKVNSISHKVNKVGLIVSLIFIFTTILVVYNAIRVAIYTHSREIMIMKLVGASNWFIRAPFLISSATYALIGILATIVIFIPLLSLLQPYLETFFIDYNFNILTYFNDNFVKIFGIEFLAAACINILASLIAVGKYSKV